MLLKRSQLWDLRLLLLRSIREENVVINQVNQFSQRLPIAKYFTHQRSYYPGPEVAMELGNVPELNPIPVVSMDRDNVVKMRGWAREHGQCVWQLTVKQRTTKFSAGTLPLSAYSVKLRQDPLDMNVKEEILEDQEEYDSDLSLSGDEFEDEEDAGDLVPRTLTTRNGRHIRAVVRLDL